MPQKRSRRNENLQRGIAAILIMAASIGAGQSWDLRPPFLTPPYGLPYGLELKNNPRLCTSLRVYGSNTPQEGVLCLLSAFFCSYLMLTDLKLLQTHPSMKSGAAKTLLTVVCAAPFLLLTA